MKNNNNENDVIYLKDISKDTREDNNITEPDEPKNKSKKLILHKRSDIKDDDRYKNESYVLGSKNNIYPLSNNHAAKDFDNLDNDESDEESDNIDE